MLTTKQFSEASGVPTGTLRRWRSKFKGSDEGRQGVLMPATVDEHGNCLYDESQIEIARRLHNPNYGQPKIIEVNTMTENTALDAQIDAHAANQAVDEQTPADVQNDAEIDDSDVVIDMKQFNAWCKLVDRIHDGELDCVNRFRRELKETAGIVVDRSTLIELANAGGKDLKKRIDNFRAWLAQFKLDFVDDKTGEMLRFVRYEDGSCGFESSVDADFDTPAELIIDDEFKALIPPLAEIERQQLEENLLRDGIRDPLVVWQGHGIIVDGHNRYSIAKAHGLPFKTTEMHFADRDAVKVWIVQNQFGRRNVNRYTRGELALKLEPSIAAQAKANQLATLKQNTETVLAKLPKRDAVNTRDVLAKIAGVSSRLMAMIQYLVDNATDEIKAALRHDEITINAAFKAVKAGAMTVEDVHTLKTNDAQAESQSPKSTREEISMPVDKVVEPTAAPTNDDDERDNDSVDGEKICDGKISAIVTATADDDSEESIAHVEETANVPNQHVPAQVFDDDDTLEVNHSTDDTNAGDDSNDRLTLRAEVDILFRRVGKLIWDADFDKLTVAKDTLAWLVAALETKTPAVDADGQAVNKFR